MAGVSKTMVAVSAVIAFGLVTVDDMAKGVAKPVAQSQAATSDDIVMRDGILRARAAAALRSLTDRQQANSETVARPKCGEQIWPYYSNDCLALRDGAKPSPTIRLVRVDRRTADQADTTPR
jgi:hypothetical protein